MMKFLSVLIVAILFSLNSFSEEQKIKTLDEMAKTVNSVKVKGLTIDVSLQNAEKDWGECFLYNTKETIEELDSDIDDYLYGISKEGKIALEVDNEALKKDIESKIGTGKILYCGKLTSSEDKGTIRGDTFYRSVDGKFFLQFSIEFKE